LASTSQRALVTGAGSGIGRAIATSLDQIGVRLVLVGRDRAKLEETRAELSEPGRDGTLVIPCDVADRAGVAALAGRVLAALGAIDILVCNAGRTSGTGASKVSIRPTGTG
jgi:NADP-dependent 3-hydroxy acid dehydrogenase YdfG